MKRFFSPLRKTANLSGATTMPLPREVVKGFKGIEYFDAVVQDGRIVLEPVRIRPVAADLAGIRKKLERLGVVAEDVVEAIQWSRSSPK